MKELKEKKCTKCHQVKPITDFRWRKDRNIWTPSCKKCFIQKESICSGMTWDKTNDIIEEPFCIDEDQTRRLAVKIGRPICGNCIKTLYATYG